MKVEVPEVPMSNARCALRPRQASQGSGLVRTPSERREGTALKPGPPAVFGVVELGLSSPRQTSPLERRPV